MPGTKPIDELAQVLAQLTADVPKSSRQKYDWPGLYANLVKRGGGFSVGMIRDICQFDLPKQQKYNRIYGWIRNHTVSLAEAKTLITSGVATGTVAFVTVEGVAVPIQTLVAAMKIPGK